MHKLIIQIPCLNEEASLPATLGDLPRRVEGFDAVEWLVVDDGSTDGTVEVARRMGVDHIVSLPRNQGLATAFRVGLETALKLGADVIVNTDGDNQYSAASIPALLRPILEGRALIVVGERPVAETAHFSLAKRVLQRFGSWVVKVASGTEVADAPSGFRAIHRDAAIRLSVTDRYTYTLETIIQAGRRQIPIVSVPVRTNPNLRPSRLVRSTLGYVARSMATIVRIFILYKPLRFFLLAAAVTLLPGAVMIVRFLIRYAMGNGQGNVQSLVLSGALVAVAAVLAIAGVLADLIATNRIMLEEIRARLLAQELEGRLSGASGPGP
ncbi:MAG: glycosyltransferase family 2 protein [Longimicrobiales bacterium]|nr:glycosyltransferase family 2 protein [Longimicrobiales bacterium]